MERTFCIFPDSIIVGVFPHVLLNTLLLYNFYCHFHESLSQNQLGI